VAATVRSPEITITRLEGKDINLCINRPAARSRVRIVTSLTNFIILGIIVRSG
jgi:hypothetical protein